MKIEKTQIFYAYEVVICSESSMTRFLVPVHKISEKKKAQEELRISAQFQKYAFSELPAILGDETTL